MSEMLLRQVPMGTFVPLLSQMLPAGCRFFVCTSRGEPLWASHGAATPAERSILSTALLGDGNDNANILQSRRVTGFGTLIWQGLGTGGIGFPGYLVAAVPDNITPPPIAHLSITFNAVCAFIREIYRTHLEVEAMRPRLVVVQPAPSGPATQAVDTHTTASLPSEIHRNQIAKLNHDLRSPLNAILGYAALLTEEMRKAELIQHVNDLDKIQQAANKLLILINRIIETTHIPDVKVMPAVEPCLIMQLLADVSFSTQPLLERRSTKLNLELGKELTEVHTETGTLRSMLIDLVAALNAQTEHNVITVDVNESDPNSVAFEISSAKEIPHFSLPASLAEGAKRIHAEILTRRETQHFTWVLRIPRVLTTLND